MNRFPGSGRGVHQPAIAVHHHDVWTVRVGVLIRGVAVLAAILAVSRLGLAAFLSRLGLGLLNFGLHLLNFLFEFLHSLLLDLRAVLAVVFIAQGFFQILQIFLELRHVGCPTGRS